MRTGAYPWTKGILPFYPGLYGTGTVEGGGGTRRFLGSRRGSSIVDHPWSAAATASIKSPRRVLSPDAARAPTVFGAVMTNYLDRRACLRRCLAPATAEPFYMKVPPVPPAPAVVQMAHWRVTDHRQRQHRKIAYLRSAGADHVFCYRQTDQKEAVLEATHGHGAASFWIRPQGGYVQPACLSRSAGDAAGVQLSGRRRKHRHSGGADRRDGKCQSLRVFSFTITMTSPEPEGPAQ